MKFLKRSLAAVVIIAIILCAFYFFWISPRYTVPILMYHRFGSDNSALFVTPENFSRQMDYLDKKGYKVISLDELVKGIKNHRSFGRKTAVITIDDGYEDNYLFAYPVLKQRHFPATIFLAANNIGREKDFMSWEEAGIMSQDIISFGSHTKNGEYLPVLEDAAALWDEIYGAKEVIENNLALPVYYFCYPTGGFTEGIKDLVKKAGYKGACTSNRGFAKLNRDWYELKRIKVTNSDTNKPFSFAAKLSGYYNLFRKQKSGH